MKRARKIVAIILMCSLLMSMTANAVSISANADAKVAKDVQSKELLAELNDLALQQNMVNSRRTELTTSEFSALKSEMSQKEAELKADLSVLGMKTLDPNNEADMERLATIMYGLPVESAEASSTATRNGLPNVANFAASYTIMEVEDTVRVDGEYYDVVTYYVTDNKGTGGLTTGDFGYWFNSARSTVIEELVDYNFGFIFSSFLGEHNLVAADWLLGNLFPIFYSYADDAAVTFGGGSGNQYSVSMQTVVQMAYHFIYLPGMMSWTTCGCCAVNLSGSRIDTVQANVNGVSVPGTRTRLFAAEIDTNVDLYAETYISDGYRLQSAMGTLIARNTWSGERLSHVPACPSYMYEIDL